MSFTPDLIKKEHILLATEKIEKEAIKLNASTGYSVLINGKIYPPKEIMKYARFIMDGKLEEWSEKGGEPTNKYLVKLGFKILEIGTKMGSLVDQYKELLQKEGLADEVYKWELIGKHKGEPNLDSKDLHAEIEKIEFNNLIYYQGRVVILQLAREKPEEYRKLLRELFNESNPVADRIKEFSLEVENLYRLVEPDKKYANHHDERTIATLLTYRSPEKYSLYKESFYSDLCKFLKIEKNKVGQKYVHYLKLVEDFVTYFLKGDIQLKELVNSLLPSSAYSDPNCTILAQDVLYRVLEEKKGGENIRYWRIGTTVGDSGESQWPNMLDKGIASIGWKEIGDLNLIKPINKEKIINLFQTNGYYLTKKSTASRKAGEIVNFYNEINTGDIILAQDGESIKGIGIVADSKVGFVDEYIFPHTKKVDWAVIEPSLICKEGFMTTVCEIKDNNLIHQINELIGIKKINFWIFQANPKKFNLEEALKENLIETWTVSAHEKKIKKGDKVIIWQSGKDSGCYALAEILDQPNKNLISKDERFWIEKNEIGGVKVAIKVTDNFAIRPILNSQIENVEELAEFNGGMQGSNFISNEEQYNFFKNYYSRTENKTMNIPLNLILYGPPGTGKTFETITKAVKIANPSFDLLNSSRIDIKKEYDKLTNDGQISFITFHQSLSYEDFIEGIKPVTASGNISYKVNPGIFKTLCIEASKFSESTNELLTEIESDFYEKYDQLVEETKNNLKNSSKVEFESKSGSTVLVDKISDLNNFSIKHHGGDRSYTVSKTRLAKLDSYFPDLSKIENIDREFREAIGGSNSSAYWAVLKELRKIKPSNIENNPKNKKSIKKKNFVLIIDEINRGNVSQIFGELITLLEDGRRLGQPEDLEVILPYSGEKFGVPSNIYIIGTMNTADRSVEALDTALRRRFEFEEMAPIYTFPQSDWKIGEHTLSEILERINLRLEKLLDRDHLIGHSYFINVTNVETLYQRFSKNIIPLLQEYFYHDYSKIGLVLGKDFIETDKNEPKIFAEFDSEDRSSFIEKKIYRVKNNSLEDFKLAISSLMISK